MLIFRTTNRGYTSKIYGDGITARSVKADDIVLLTDYQGNITVKIAYYDINDNFLGLYNFTNLAPGSVYGAYTMSHDASYIAYLHTIPSAVIANRGLLKFSFQFIDANGVVKNTPIFTENIADSVYTIDSDAQPTIVLDNRYWPIADTNQVGLVKVDGTTIRADADGTIHMVDIDKLEGDIDAQNANLLYPTITSPTLSGEVDASAATVNGGILKAVELKGTIQADGSEINNPTLNEANINNATLLGNLVGNNSHIKGFSFDGTLDFNTTVPSMGAAQDSVATKGYVDFVVSRDVGAHTADKNNPHETTGANAKIEKSSAQTIKDYVDNGLTNTLQQAKAYSDTKQSSKTSFVYETLNNFLENVKYTTTDTTATLTKIIDEYGTEYPASDLEVGSVNVYLREQDVPDYWLSKKQVEVAGTFSPLDFFLPLEAEMDVDLTNYVTYTDYATPTKGGVVKVSAENGVKIDTEGQLSINPATAEEIQSGTGNKAITSSNLPNANRENKGVVKLSSSFDINADGNLDIPVIDIGTLPTETSYSRFGSITLTDEQIAKIQNSNNILLKFNEASITGHYRHVNMARTGETYNAGELYAVQFASTSLSPVGGSGIFIANLTLPSKELKYTKTRLWKDFNASDNYLNLSYWGNISSINQEQVRFATINNQSIVGTSSNITTSIKLTNTAVSTWASDATYADYPYKATIAATGVTSTMVAEVVYSIADAESGNYAPICETYDGGIYIYSKVNTAITIPTILVVK